MSRSDRTLTNARPRGRLRAHVDGDGVAALGEQGVDLALERLEILEALVDAGEPDVGDLVDAAELLHRERPDARRRHLTHAGAAQFGFDGVGRGLRGAGWDRSPGQRLAQARDEPVAIELLPGASRRA